MLSDRVVDPKQLHNRAKSFPDVVGKIHAATKFVLSPHFAQAADDLSEQLNNLIKLLPFCRLPYPMCWFEVSQADRPSFAKAPMEDTDLPVSRVGFLVEQQADGVSWRAHLLWQTAKGAIGQSPFGGTPLGGSVSCAGLVMTFDIRKLVSNGATPEAVIGKSIALEKADFVDKLPTIFRNLVTSPSDWEGEGGYLVAILGLLNAKNVASTEAVDIRQLNKARRKLGRRPFFDYHVLNISPRVFARRKSSGQSADDERGMMRAHWVRGHFKVRKTGVFFWSPYHRGNPAVGVVSKDYVVA